MPPHSSSSALPPGRTGHACVQCRHRKQRCGGFTYGIKCRPCTTRKVKCSFQEEVKDLRYNPYLQLRNSRSPSIIPDGRPTDSLSQSSSSDPFLSTATELHGERTQPQLSTASAIRSNTTPVDHRIPGEIEILKSRISDLEKRLGTASRDHDDCMQTPRSDDGRFIHSFGTAPSNQSYQAPPITSIGPLANTDPSILSNPQGGFIADGPLKALHSFRAENPSEFELNDPVARSILTEGEAYVIFRLYFTNCHPNAPFLDTAHDNDIDRIRSSSVLLFLSILSVGARFWGTSSKSSCWLHDKYSELIRLLDAELMRVTMRSRHDDQRIETVQALLLCAHWMPFDLVDHREKFRSRFSEGGAWQCLGLAIRWASYISLDRTCHVNFHNPETVTRHDARRFRTMLYLVESDHYLALSARRSFCLSTESLNDVVANFLRCKYVQSTDIRLASLFRVANSAHFTGCRPKTIESVEAFDKDVQLIEQEFLRTIDHPPVDGFNQHFPFISLRWYRLSYACAFLNVTDQTQRTGKVFTWAIEWASQILIYLAGPSFSKEAIDHAVPAPLEPDRPVVDMMSFAIDHYNVVIAYAAFFLVKSWLSNLMNMNLHLRSEHFGEMPGEASHSLLFRLVDLAARTLDTASPTIGHLARRYVPLLRGMTALILSGNTQDQVGGVDGGVSIPEANNSMQTEPMQNTLGEDLWEMWQQAGLEPMIWPSVFDDIYEGP